MNIGWLLLVCVVAYVSLCFGDSLIIIDTNPTYAAPGLYAFDISLEEVWNSWGLSSGVYNATLSLILDSPSAQGLSVAWGDGVQPLGSYADLQILERYDIIIHQSSASVNMWPGGSSVAGYCRVGSTSRLVRAEVTATVAASADLNPMSASTSATATTSAGFMTATPLPPSQNASAGMMPAASTTTDQAEPPKKAKGKSVALEVLFGGLLLVVGVLLLTVALAVWCVCSSAVRRHSGPSLVLESDVPLLPTSPAGSSAAHALEPQRLMSPWRAFVRMRCCSLFCLVLTPGTSSSSP